MHSSQSETSGTPLPPSTVGSATCQDYSADHVRQAVSQALSHIGGMSAFISPGQTVLVNPNLLSPHPPAAAVTTHPAVVGAVVGECIAAGARRVWVGDSPAGNHGEQRLWSETGVRAAVEEAGGEMKSFRGPARPEQCGERRIPVPVWYDDVDVLISVPKLKTHLLTVLTCALKNVYGMIPGQAKSLFHGDYPSPASMSAFLVDVFSVFRPSLSIVDAVVAMEGDGPSGGRAVPVGAILASADAVAIDCCAAAALGLRPEDIPMIRLAAARALGNASRDRIDLRGDAGEALEQAGMKPARGRILQCLPDWAFRELTRVLTYRPRVRDKACVRCGICAETCSQDAIQTTEDGAYRICDSTCILCMCCLESCPCSAIDVRSPLLAILRLIQAVRTLLPRRNAQSRQAPRAPTNAPPD